MIHETSERIAERGRPGAITRFMPDDKGSTWVTYCRVRDIQEPHACWQDYKQSKRERR